MKTSVSILGGVGEIGMNCYVYETDRDAVIVDCGVMFTDYANPGVDYIIPDLSYLDEIKHKLRAVVLTHGHEDHIGAVSYLLKKVKLPVYGGALTLGILGCKLTKSYRTLLKTISPRETVEIGSLSVQFLPVTHSICDTYALLISTEDFKGLHCSDFKIDQTPVWGEPFNPEDFSRLSKSGLTTLMLDSTNVIHNGFTQSESSIKDELSDIFHKAEGRIFFTSFSSNIDRFRQVLDVCRETGRKVVIEGASLQRNIKVAEDTGFMKLPKELIVSLKHAQNLKDERLCYLITGSQGETNSSLYRIASKERKDLQVKDGDTFVISARVIPGNEKNLNNLINLIYLNGGSVVDIAQRKIHVSGHASAEEVKMMINLTRPAYLIPVHGEHMHLAVHMKVAETTGMIGEHVLPMTDGHRATFISGRLDEVVEIPAGKEYVDLRGKFHINDEEIRTRKHICRDGVVVVQLLYQKGKKVPAAPPEVKTIGFSIDDSVMFELRKHLSEQAETLLPEYSGSRAILEDYLQKITRRFFKKTHDRRPVISAVVTEI